MSNNLTINPNLEHPMTQLAANDDTVTETIRRIYSPDATATRPARFSPSTSVAIIRNLADRARLKNGRLTPHEALALAEHAEAMQEWMAGQEWMAE